MCAGSMVGDAFVGMILCVVCNANLGDGTGVSTCQSDNLDCWIQIQVIIIDILSWGRLCMHDVPPCRIMLYIYRSPRL